MGLRTVEMLVARKNYGYVLYNLSGQQGRKKGRENDISFVLLVSLYLL